MLAKHRLRVAFATGRVDHQTRLLGKLVVQYLVELRELLVQRALRSCQAMALMPDDLQHCQHELNPIRTGCAKQGAAQ
jgi:hypothetical protein